MEASSLEPSGPNSGIRKPGSLKPGTLKFHGIEAGRGLAALFVVFHHAGNNIAEPRFYNTVIFGGHLGNFNVGVDFFFVLSGFIIAWVHWADIGQPARLKRYAVRRLLRIYPPYWVILIPLAVLYFLTPGTGKASQHDPADLFFSLTLLPYPNPPIIGAAWTLVHEMIFYAVFGLIIAFGRRAIWVLPAWALAIVVAQFGPPLRFPFTTLLSAFNLEFLIGVLAALVLRSHAVPYPRFVAAAGCLSFLALMLFATTIQDNPLVGRLAFGLSAAAAIFGTVELERAGRLRVPRALIFLGSASYAVYLIHGFVLSMTIQVATRVLPKSIPLPLILLLIVTVAVAAGCLFHRFVERSLNTTLRRRLLFERAVVSGAS